MSIKVLTSGAKNLLVKRIASPFLIRRRWLDKTQWLDKDKLSQIQLDRLKRIVSHSYNTVPYYRKLMDQYGIIPSMIKTPNDIKLFPILTKNDILDAGDSIISTSYPRWLLHSARTGGSTGSPLMVHRNFSSIGNEHAFVRRQWDWAGVKLSDRCAYLMSRVVAKPDRTDGRLYAYDPFMRDLILSTHHLSRETAIEYASLIKKYSVKAIVGYPSAISFLAKTILDAGIELDLKAALTTSEILTESMAETITKAFGCRVCDFYGSAERVCYIHTCEHGHYHIIPEYGLTELIALSESSGKYKVISTGFWNMAMPLIRYDTGDIVTVTGKKCCCGRVFDVVDSIDGRAGDVIKTPSGRQLGVTLMIQLLYVICGTQHIIESQIVQDQIDHLTIKYVPSDVFTRKDLDDFDNLITRFLPSELKFGFEEVDAIERTGSGKIRPLVSLIN
ncbi:phenylacetate--CoA ligase family protein [Planctomycetota bacterium]